MTCVRPPSVDTLARSLSDTGLPHQLLVEVARAAIAAGEPDSAEQRVEDLRRSLLTPVINATGVLLHTNLGRAPFAFSTEATYTNLELNLATGKRGSRHDHAPTLLARACGAEAAIVVNNGAGAVLLALAAVAGGRDVPVSRGELVEIGGGFRIPDVMDQSGAHMVEVGTTNRTRLADFSKVIDDPTTDVACTLSVHRSNYEITGFTEMVNPAELATLGVPCIVDLGSGLLDAACPWLDGPPPAWLRDEPAVRQTIEAGANLVIFSGDKLLGGPQAGIIAGDAELVRACAKHPLARALRAGGLTLGALQELAMRYLDRDGLAIPFWRMATTPTEALRSRAEALVAAAGIGRVIDTDAVPGGGTMPSATIPSVGIAIEGDRTDALRSGTHPIIARVHEGTTVVDLRTVDPASDPVVGAALQHLTPRQPA